MPAFFETALTKIFHNTLDMPPLEFTVKEKTISCIQILEQEIDIDKFEDKGLPADTHMVTYVVEGKTLNDTVRAYTMVDIFDAYYDKLKDVGEL